MSFSHRSSHAEHSAAPVGFNDTHAQSLKTKRSRIPRSKGSGRDRCPTTKVRHGQHFKCAMDRGHAGYHIWVRY